MTPAEEEGLPDGVPVGAAVVRVRQKGSRAATLAVAAPLEPPAQQLVEWAQLTAQKRTPGVEQPDRRPTDEHTFFRCQRDRRGGNPGPQRGVPGSPPQADRA